MIPEPPRFRPPTQESMLLDLVLRLNHLREGRIGLYLHLSKLSHAYRRERYLRIATDSFASSVSAFEGALFPLESGDLFFLAKDTTPSLLEAAVTRLQGLFSQDPLVLLAESGGRNGFCTWYDLTRDYDALLALAQKVLGEAEEKREKQVNPLLLSAEKEPTPISPDILAKVEQTLETVDVTNITRRQPVCTLLDNRAPQILFEEVFISVDDLQRIVTPGVNLAGNPWLFRYLTQTLDWRTLLMLIRDGVSSAHPFSLNLNVSTVLTPEFTKFETAITPQLRGRLVIEMNHLDVFSDLGAFLFARDYLHDHGFRLCLDGLTHHTFRYYNRAVLGFDLVKLFWSPNAIDEMPPAMLPNVRNIVMETGQAHTILCHCDDERAIQTGMDLGIVMFQGRFVDKLVNETRNPYKSIKPA